MRIRESVLVGLLALPAVAWGQGGYDQGEPSIIRQTGLGWRNQVSVAEGCGCDVPVRADCYDQPCCFRCGLRPLCFLQRIHRMLDCLLPCHGCLFACGRYGCCGPVCCSPGCSPGGSSSLPGFSDPFVDDPLRPVPPKPLADPGTEVRYLPPARTAPVPAIRNSPSASRTPQSPYKVIGAPTRQAVHHAAPSTPAPRRIAPRSDLQAIQIQPPPARAKPVEQSVLRRTAAEEPAPLTVEPDTARPIIRSQSPEEPSDDSIPFNPLRGR